MTKRLQNYTDSWPFSLPAEVVRSSLLDCLTRASNASFSVLAAPSGHGDALTVRMGKLTSSVMQVALFTLVLGKGHKHGYYAYI